MSSSRDDPARKTARTRISSTKSAMRTSANEIDDDLALPPVLHNRGDSSRAQESLIKTLTCKTTPKQSSGERVGHHGCLRIVGKSRRTNLRLACDSAEFKRGKNAELGETAHIPVDLGMKHAEKPLWPSTVPHPNARADQVPRLLSIGGVGTDQSVLQLIEENLALEWARNEGVLYIRLKLGGVRAAESVTHVEGGRRAELQRRSGASSGLCTPSRRLTPTLVRPSSSSATLLLDALGASRGLRVPPGGPARPPEASGDLRGPPSSAVPPGHVRAPARARAPRTLRRHPAPCPP